MDAYRDVVQDSAGNALVGATVAVTNAGDGQPSLIFYDKAGANAVPGGIVTTGDLGRFEFYASPGRYNLNVSYGGAQSYLLEGVLVGSIPLGVSKTWSVAAGQTLVVPAGEFQDPMPLTLVPGAGGTMTAYVTIAADTADTNQWEQWLGGTVSARTTYVLNGGATALILVATTTAGTALALT
jgi:hypothetical protein